MKLRNFFIAASTIFAILISNMVFADSKSVYLENKETFIKCYKSLRDFNSYKDEKAFDHAVKAKEMIALSKTTLDVLTKGIPEGFKAFQKTNADARKLSFEPKTRHLAGYIVSCEKKLKSARDTFIKKIEKRIGWIERANNAEKALKYYNEMEKFFAELEKSYPNDEDVIAAKERLIAEANEKASSLLEQHKAKVAAFTMLKDNKKVSDIDLAKKRAGELFKGIFKTDPIRVTIPYEWEKREEYALVNDKIQHRDYHAAKATIAYLDSAVKKFFVKEILIKKVEGQISLLAYGDKHEILESNIKK